MFFNVVTFEEFVNKKKQGEKEAIDVNGEIILQN